MATRLSSPDHGVLELGLADNLEITVEVHMSREVAHELMAEANRRLNSDRSEKRMPIDIVTPILHAINLYRDRD